MRRGKGSVYPATLCINLFTPRMLQPENQNRLRTGSLIGEANSIAICGELMCLRPKEGLMGGGQPVKQEKAIRSVN